MLKSAKVEAEKAARERGDHEYRFPIEGSLYDLRHTAIENLKAAGAPLDVAHVLAGHRSIVTTLKHYNKPTEERRREAATMVSEWLSRRAVATRSTSDGNSDITKSPYAQGLFKWLRMLDSNQRPAD